MDSCIRFTAYHLKKRSCPVKLGKLLVIMVFLFFSNLLSAGLSGYSGKLEKTDRQLVEHFIKKSALYGKYGKVSRLKEILLELKTAERILNRRSRPLMKQLARAYLKAAQGFLFYFEYDKRLKPEFLIHAELCLRSAHRLDRSNFGELYRFMLALKRQKAEMLYARRDLVGLAKLRKQLGKMGEGTGDLVLKEKIINYRKRQQILALKRKNTTLMLLESRFERELKSFKLARIQASVTVYRPFLRVVNTILDRTPHPPGGTYFLHQLMKKYHCRKEVMFVLRKKR